MNIRDRNREREREREIADIIREYSKGDVDRNWLLSKNRDTDNVFKNSFNAIKDYTGDFDLALWYLAFSQSFGRSTNPMLRKMAELCTNADKEIITFKKDVPAECPYRNSKDEMIEDLLSIDCNKSSNDIISEIKEIMKSEKFHHTNKWCNLEAFNSCEYRNECPVSAWKELINKHRLPFRTEPKIFFYYDSLCLLNNSRISNFKELFSKVDSFTCDKTKKTVIIRTILEQIRGIATKIMLFLQMEKILNERDLDYAELIFVDAHVRRIAGRIQFPFYHTQNDAELIEAIRKFSENYNLTARQIDFALWEMGFLCTAGGCLHGVGGKRCIFYDVCSYEKKQQIKTE